MSRARPTPPTPQGFDDECRDPSVAFGSGDHRHFSSGADRVTDRSYSPKLALRGPHRVAVLPALIAGVPIPQGVPKSAVRDTIAAVFAQRAYDRSLRQSLLDRLLADLFELLGRLFQAVGRSPATRPITIAALVLLAALAVARIIIMVRSARLGGVGDGPRRFLGRKIDPWTEAQRLAGAGRYTDAAHALYAALLQAVAQREDIGLHPSKTVGDYLRELRRRSSALMPSFRDFARLYEVVVYGWGVCDQERYERLHALASGMLTPPQA